MTAQNGQRLKGQEDYLIRAPASNSDIKCFRSFIVQGIHTYKVEIYVVERCDGNYIVEVLDFVKWSEKRVSSPAVKYAVLLLKVPDSFALKFSVSFGLRAAETIYVHGA